MAYEKPAWAKYIQNKYQSLVPSLGQLSDSAIQERDRTSMDNIPMPGTIRRDMPDVTIPLKPMPTSGGQLGGIATDIYSKAVGQGLNTIAPTQIKQGGLTLQEKGMLTYKNVSEFLEKFDPSMVLGVLKTNLQEATESAKRLLGGSVATTYFASVSPEYRKLVSGQKLTEQEAETFLRTVYPALENTLKQTGFTDIEKQFSNQSLAGDVFNVGSAAATILPVLGATKNVATGFAGMTKTALSDITKAGTKQATQEAVLSGTRTMTKRVGKDLVEEIIQGTMKPLLIDTADNVFAQSLSGNVIRAYLQATLKQSLKLADDSVGAILKQTYQSGIGLEMMQEARKFIDPEAAERIISDQRKFVDSLSTRDRLVLDLGLGIYFPMSIPGMNTLKKTFSTGADMIAMADADLAVTKKFADSKSLQVLEELSKFRDVDTQMRMDIQMLGNLRKHTLQYMSERNIAPSVAHVEEVLDSFTGDLNNPIVKAMLDSDKASGQLSHLSWYSEKLGRALEPHERLMHWFVTETRRDYVGDLGDGLEAAFKEALNLRTTGIGPSLKTVYRTVVTPVSELKRLQGDVLRFGEVGEIRSYMDTLLVTKAEALGNLDVLLSRKGIKLFEEGENFRIPNSLINDLEIKPLIDTIRELTEAIADTRSAALGRGVPENILEITTDKKLMDEMRIYQDTMSLTNKAAANRDIYNIAKSSVDMQLAGQVRRMVKKVGSDYVLAGRNKLGERFRREIVAGDVASILDPGNTRAVSDEEILNFVMSLPTQAETKYRIPKELAKVLSEAEKRATGIQEAINRFDHELILASRVGAADLNDIVLKNVFAETKLINAQLPTGAFHPSGLAHRTRWDEGVTAIPIATPEELNVSTWSKVVAQLQDANGVTRWLTDYMTPHRPSDIYVKAMNKLNTALEQAAPGQAEQIMRDISKLQDRGISLFPVMPGGGPRWEALGSPNITGVQWGDLDKIGLKYGVDKLGELSRKVFINAISESGMKPGVVDRLRAAPGIGQLYDALYRQYMLARFAFNPLFHLQQMPETAIIGVLRSFSLPTDLASNYLKSIVRSPTKSLSASEQSLYKLIRKGDLSKGLGEITQETRMGEDLIKATTWEENKRLHAFIAEFPVRLRGELFQMPILGNTDPLAIEKYREVILSAQNNPDKIKSLIESASATTSLDPLNEAVRRAVRSTNIEVQKLTTYNLNRSALEKDLHAIFFPFSYGKKFWSEVGGAVIGPNTTLVTPLKVVKVGGVIKPVVLSEMFGAMEEMNESPSAMQIRARFSTWTSWMWNLSPVNPDYPIINTAAGSIGFGGFRGDPAQAVLIDTLTNGKYNLMENPEDAVKKLGGGGARFISDLPSAYAEIFSQHTPEQQRRVIYNLRRLQLKRAGKESEKVEEITQ